MKLARNRLDILKPLVLSEITLNKKRYVAICRYYLVSQTLLKNN